MTAARTNKCEQEQHTGIKDGERKKIRKHRKKNMKSVLKAATVAKLLGLESLAGDIATRIAIFFLLSWTTISCGSTAAAAVTPPLRELINKNQTKLVGCGGCSSSCLLYTSDAADE